MIEGALLLSRKDAAGLLGISTRMLDYAIESGLLRPRKLGRRVMIPRAELERFAAKDHPRIIPMARGNVTGGA